MTIELQDVSAWYGDVIAINGISMTMDAPIVGLLGPNGAGKSTMIALLSGLRRPNTGRVLINGLEPYDNPDVVHNIGLVPEPLAPSKWLTGRRFVMDLARMSGMSKYEAYKETAAVLKQLDMLVAMDRPIRTYSQGMRQRVKLAQAMIHKPQVLLLDEPFTGLDPPGRAMMTRAIKQLAANGTQVLFSSHILSEVEAVTNDVALIMFGRVLAKGTIREVRAAMSDVPLKVKVETMEPRSVADRLIGLDDVDGIDIQSDGLVVHTTRGTTFFREMTKLGAELPIESYEPIDEDLESVYNLLTRRGT